MLRRQCELSRVVFCLDGFCAFPFIYRGVKKYECLITSGSPRPWCSLTTNYRHDQKWSYCQTGGLSSCHLAGFVSSEYYQTKIILFTATFSRLVIHADPNSVLCITYPMAELTKVSLVHVCVEVITT